MNVDAGASVKLFLEPESIYPKRQPMLFENVHGDLHSRPPVDVSATFKQCDNFTSNEQGHLPPSKRCYYSADQNRRSSYDRYTTFQLNKLYYETFGNDRDVTNSDCRKIEEETGVSWKKLSRGIYYRKRHYQVGLEVYKRLARAEKITGYKSFLEYCKTHRVPGLHGYRYGILP